MFTHFIQSVAIILVVIAIATANVAYAQDADTTIRVDINNGSLNPPELGQLGWGSNAYRFLQDALDAAHFLIETDEEIDTVEIWVAAGTYRPDQRAANSACGEGPAGPNCCPPYGDCNVALSFSIEGNISLFGGFTGGEETLGQRNWVANPTILSGDLREDDVITIDYDGNGVLQISIDNDDENSRAVVRAPVSSDVTVVLDGFTIQRAIETLPVILIEGDPNFILQNCIVKENRSAFVAGGIEYLGAQGGGRLELRGTTVKHTSGGGGIAMWGTNSSELLLIGSTVKRNVPSSFSDAGSGGGVSTNFPNVTLVNARLIENFSELDGAGLRATGQNEGKVRLWNCLIADNRVLGFGVGGGVYVTGVNLPQFPGIGVDLEIVNCTIANNVSPGDGGGVHFDSGAQLEIANSIAWGNSIPALNILGPNSEVSHSIIEGPTVWPGVDNLNANPLFEDPANGNYRLTAGSPAVDAGNNCLLPCDEYKIGGVISGWHDPHAECTVVCDVNGKNHRHPIDLDEIPRVMVAVADEPTVDMGAYELDLSEEMTCIGDIDPPGGNGVRNVFDLLVLLGSWGPCPDCNDCPADIDPPGTGNCVVNVFDLLVLLGNWGPCPTNQQVSPPQTVQECWDLYSEQMSRLTECLEMVALLEQYLNE